MGHRVSEGSGAPCEWRGRHRVSGGGGAPCEWRGGHCVPPEHLSCEVWSCSDAHIYTVTVVGEAEGFL